MMLNVDADTYILTQHTTLSLAFYLAFLMTFGQKIIRWFLPKFPVALDKMDAKNSDGQDPFWESKRDKFFPLLKAYGVTLAIFAIAGILSILFPAV